MQTGRGSPGRGGCGRDRTSNAASSVLYGIGLLTSMETGMRRAQPNAYDYTPTRHRPSFFTNFCCPAGTSVLPIPVGLFTTLKDPSANHPSFASATAFLRVGSTNSTP